MTTKPTIPEEKIATLDKIAPGLLDTSQGMSTIGGVEMPESVVAAIGKIPTSALDNSKPRPKTGNARMPNKVVDILETIAPGKLEIENNIPKINGVEVPNVIIDAIGKLPIDGLGSTRNKPTTPVTPTTIDALNTLPIGGISVKRGVPTIGGVSVPPIVVDALSTISAKELEISRKSPAVKAEEVPPIVIDILETLAPGAITIEDRIPKIDGAKIPPIVIEKLASIDIKELENAIGPLPSMATPTPVVSETTAEVAVKTLIDNTIENFRTAEGTNIHVGQDSSNITLPLGMVADLGTVKTRGGKVITTEEEIRNLSKADVRDLDYSNATHTVGIAPAPGKETRRKVKLKRSDFEGFDEDGMELTPTEVNEAYAGAALEVHRKNAAAEFAGFEDLDSRTQQVVLSYSWNAGSVAIGWSGFKAAVKESIKPNPDYAAVIEGMTRHAITAQKSLAGEYYPKGHEKAGEIKSGASKGLAKKRGEEYNHLVPESERVYYVEQITEKDGTATFIYKDRDKKTVYTKKTGIKPATVKDKASKDGEVSVPQPKTIIE